MYTKYEDTVANNRNIPHLTEITIIICCAYVACGIDCLVYFFMTSDMYGIILAIVFFSLAPMCVKDPRKENRDLGSAIAGIIVHIGIHCFVFWKAPVAGIIVYICEAAACVLTILIFKKLGIRIRH